MQAPNPGGGFYDGPNINVGNVNPWAGRYESQAYSTVGWPTRRPASETVADAPMEK